MRFTDADFARFLGIALASSAEVEYFALLSRDLGLFSGEQLNRIGTDVAQIQKMLVRLTEKLRSSQL